MGLISGILMGMIFGVALMAGWKHMSGYRSTKRIAKVSQLREFGAFWSLILYIIFLCRNLAEVAVFVFFF